MADNVTGHASPAYGFAKLDGNKVKITEMARASVVYGIPESKNEKIIFEVALNNFKNDCEFMLGTVDSSEGKECVLLSVRKGDVLNFYIIERSRLEAVHVKSDKEDAKPVVVKGDSNEIKPLDKILPTQMNNDNPEITTDPLREAIKVKKSAALFKAGEVESYIGSVAPNEIPFASSQKSIA